MDTRIDQIADHLYRISTFQPFGPPGGLTMNQFLLTGDAPLLFHTGSRPMFPAVHDAVASVIDPGDLRWISSGHASRPDEFGALGEWMEVAPQATVVHGSTGCFVCLAEMSPRPPQALGDGERLDLGDLEVQWVDTPHVPGPWEAGVLFERTTRTLLCGDLFAQAGAAPVTTADDIVEAAIAHEQMMHSHAITRETGPTLRRLAALEPQRLALMHGPTFVGDGGGALRRLAAYFDACLLAPA
jgi:flavorubredoxin